MNNNSIKTAPQVSTPLASPLHAKTMSFNELALRYLASNKHLLSEPVLNARIAHLSELLLAFFGMQLLIDIRPARLEKFIYILEGEGHQPRKIQSCLVTFRACMKYAYEQKWLTDPVLSKPLLRMNQQLLDDHNFMSSGEYQDLFQDLVEEVTHQTFH